MMKNAQLKDCKDCPYNKGFIRDVKNKKIGVTCEIAGWGKQAVIFEERPCNPIRQQTIKQITDLFKSNKTYKGGDIKALINAKSDYVRNQTGG